VVDEPARDPPQRRPELPQRLPLRPQNPVRAGLARDPAAWRWSSYRATIGMALADLPLASDELLRKFGRRRTSAVARFRDFLTQRLPQRPRWQRP